MLARPERFELDGLSRRQGREPKSRANEQGMCIILVWAFLPSPLNPRECEGIVRALGDGLYELRLASDGKIERCRVAS